jgi:hypothetical protein
MSGQYFSGKIIRAIGTAKVEVIINKAAGYQIETLSSVKYGRYFRKYSL